MTSAARPGAGRSPAKGRISDMAYSLSGGKLPEDVLHRGGALLPGGQLGVDAQLLWTGEAGMATLLADELDDLRAVERRVLHELELHRLVGNVDARHAQRPRGDAHHVALDQGARRLGQLAEAVDELLAQRLEILACRGVGEPLVEREPLVHVAAVGRRKQSRYVQVHFGRNIDRTVQLGRLAGLQLANRAIEHPRVERKTDFLHLAGLLFAEDLAGAADLEVVHGEVEARSELLHGLDRLEALHGILVESILGRGKEVSVRLVVRAPNPPAELVELCQAEAIGAVDDDGVGARIVDPGLDDGRAEKHARALRGEIAHDPLELALAHLAVRHRDARLGQQALEAFAHALDRVHFVVQEVALAAALELPHHRLADQALGPGRDEGLDREALLRRGGDHREVANSLQRQGERSRDRGRREREDVHLGAQALHRLLLAHAEAVLLVDDHEPQALELYVLRKELVRADDDVDLTGFELAYDVRGFLGASEARELGDVHRPVGEAVLEG